MAEALLTYTTDKPLGLTIGDEVKVTLVPRPSFPEYFKATVVYPFHEGTAKAVYSLKFDTTQFPAPNEAADIVINKCDINGIEKWDCCAMIMNLEDRYEALLTYLNLSQSNNGIVTPN
jgi:hypothetical protein